MSATSLFRKSPLLVCLLSSAAFVATPAFAQEGTTAAAAVVDDLGDILVTAQKRTENLQSVPISIQAFGTEKLNQLQVKEFGDVVRFLPSVTLQTAGPGFTQVYFRGVASGENANHSTSLPTVGVYLDEQPITTIQGALDIHAYDLARVEALAGPQGTLYGASSMAGTIRIITNKPDSSKFYGAVDGEINTVADGGVGGVLQGFVNAPLGDRAAIRTVAWYRKDAGFIDNQQGCRTYPTSGIEQCNDALAKENYNDVDTYGGRIALGIDLDDDWTITPAIMGQIQNANGSFTQQSNLPRQTTEQYNPEVSKDRWFQAALTVEGAIGNWDVTYAGAYLKRKVETESDYSDYAYFYDALFGYGAYFTDNNDELVSPNQYIKGIDRYTKQSHELRIASPASERLRFIGGLFFQRQTHNIEQNYIIDNIADAITVTGTDSNIWLTKQFRVDRDYAAFGQMSFDFTEKLTGTAGLRVYRFKNSLEGFFGYSAGFSSRTGEAACFGPAVVEGSPCTNVDKTTSGTGTIGKLNLTYTINDDALVYATWSSGFRPGGVNRRGTLDPYDADKLNNFELGWKTSWADRRLRFNGAIYQQNWDGVQLSFLGANGLTEVRNAGKARIRGIEADIGWRENGLTLSAGGSFNDAKLTRDFCKIANVDFDCTVPADNELLAPTGSRLPVTARFNFNSVARYEWDISEWQAHVQGAVVHVGSRLSDVRPDVAALEGDLPAYTTADFSIGASNDRFSVELFATNLFNANGLLNRSFQCGEGVCGDPEDVTASGGISYSAITRPRLIGLKFGAKF